MRTALVNLSNKAYEQSRLRLNISARKSGLTDIRSYDFEDIKSTEFYGENKEILDQPTGAGYWLWKPYLILETLRMLSDNDIVIYADSGLEIIAPLDPLIDLCLSQEPVVLFGNGNDQNSAWIKRDCFVLMDCDSEPYWKALQCDAAFCLFRKTPQTLRFVEEWLRLACDRRLLTDQPNTCGKNNFPDFREHRRDQAILSLLAQKYRLPLFRMPTQFGNHYKMFPFRVLGEFNCVNQFSTGQQLLHYSLIPYYNSPYFQLLDHHRSRVSQPGEDRVNIKSWVQRRIKKLVRLVKTGRYN